MICVSIAQESRKLALVDMLNAAMMGADLIEVRLDCFENDPSFSELLSARRKPVIFSCRRKQDGGQWQGTEEERLTLLRQAIIAKADYVEIELDAADGIRPFPPCQRVISYTNLKETPANIADIYAEARTKKPDVIKLTCRARTPEEAWPLVQILAKPPVPTVVVGLGRPGLMLAVLGRKIGAPWTYAAIERGAEAYPGQPTVRDLDEVYHYRAIDRATRLFGVVGLDERAFVATGLFNAAFAALKSPARCLPTQLGDPKLFGKIIDAVKLAGVHLEPDAYNAARDLAATFDPLGTAAHAADALLRQQDGTWAGINDMAPAAITAVADALRRPAGDIRLKGTGVMIVGTDPQARLLAHAFKEAGAALMFSSPDRDASHRLAARVGGRLVPWEALYTTMHEVLVVTGIATPGADVTDVPEIRPGYLRAGMAILDLTASPRPSALLKEAKARGCATIDPAALLAGQVGNTVRRLAGQPVPEGAFDAVLEALADQEE